MIATLETTRRGSTGSRRLLQCRCRLSGKRVDFREKTARYQGGNAVNRLNTRGSVQFCIDLGSIPEGMPLESHHRTLAVVEAILDSLHRHGLLATWAVPPWAASRLIETLAAGKHELALTATSAWFSSSRKRSDIERTLQDVRQRHEAAGVSLSSLVVASTLPESYGALLANHGMRVLRQGHVARGWLGAPTRIGRLWRVPVTGTLPGTGGWLARWDHHFQAKASLHRALTQRRTEHVAIDMQEVTAGRGGRVSTRTLDRIFRLAGRLVAAEKLAVETLAMAAARWAAPTTRHSQRSVLRPAA